MTGGTTTGGTSQQIRRIVADQLSNTLTDEPVLTPEAFASAAKRSSAPYTFATSRSEKPTAYSNPDHVGRICAESLALMGVDADDGLLNLCAPHPHLSGFAAIHGTRILGTAIFNDHFDDYHRVLEEGHAEDVTVFSTTPSMALAVAAEIRERYGDPTECFPNLERALLGGEVVRPGARRRVKEAWGVEHTREYYGSSEACMVASGVDESRRLVPHLHRFVLEIDVDGEILDVREPTTPTEGSILITDPDREAVDLTRYRQGDRVRVHPGDELPRIEVLGREDHAINVDGALLHPGDLYGVVDSVYPEATACVPYVRESSSPLTLELFLVGASAPRREAFLETLAAAHSAVGHALDAAREERVILSPVGDIEKIPLPDPASLVDTPVVFQSALENG